MNASKPPVAALHSGRGSGQIRRGRMAADDPHESVTRISSAAILDARLSFKARGLLGWLASHQDGSGCSVDTIVAATQEGRTAVRSGLKELDALGYLNRTQSRDPETGRLLSASYQVKPAILP